MQFKTMQKFLRLWGILSHSVFFSRNLEFFSKSKFRTLSMSSAAFPAFFCVSNFSQIRKKIIYKQMYTQSSSFYSETLKNFWKISILLQRDNLYWNEIEIYPHRKSSSYNCLHQMYGKTLLIQFSYNFKKPLKKDSI